MHLRGGGFFFSIIGIPSQSEKPVPPMAVIRYPMSMAVVKGLRRTADFYFQRGRQVVRYWPKKSNLVPTPKQKIQRDNFRAIECALQAQGPQQRKAWQDWQPYTGQTWVDFLHRVWMKPAFEGTLFTLPDFTDYFYKAYGPGQGRGLVIRWNASRWSDPRPFYVVCTPARDDGGLWPWQVFDYKLQRGRYRQARWCPSLGEYSIFPNFGWHPETGEVIFHTPSSWPSLLFACLPYLADDPTPLLSPCMRALPRYF